MTAEELRSKARQAASSARLLLNAGDTAGACNRAYYAMFDAARAALLRSGTSVPSELGKTHSGLIHAFSQQLVKSGQAPKELGQSLARAHELRLIADYTGNQVEVSDAQSAVERAEHFVAALECAPPP